MQRIALSTVPLCGFAMSLLLVLAPVTRAQTPEQSEAPEITAVVGAPFSGVGIQENVRVTADGNRFIHKITSRYFRDGQGRTRLERELPIRFAVLNPAEIPQTLVTINNKVTGEIDSLFPAGKVASVVQRPGMKVVDAPACAPEIFTSFDGIRFGPKDPGWSAPISLGEKSIEGLHAAGTQRVYTLAAGAVGNQKPVTITVQQWSSPDLGVILDKTATASTGGQVHYQLQQIVQAEPNADLFTVPADYKKMLVSPGTGNVVAVGSTTSTPATTQQ